MTQTYCDADRAAFSRILFKKTFCFTGGEIVGPWSREL
jgi:hypothetical protein